MGSRIRWRLTLTYVAVVFVVMSALGIILSYLVERQFVDDIQTALYAHAQLLTSQIEHRFRSDIAPGDLDGICRSLGSQTRARVVVRDRHGVVLGDSETHLVETDSSVPHSMKGLSEGFGCRICHSEVRNPGTAEARVPVVIESKMVGEVTLFASLYEAKHAAGRTRRIIVVTLLITSLIVAAVTARLAGSIAVPVSRMNEMAREMAAGDLTKRVEVTSRDEIGQLASSLNSMADRLQMTLDKLDEERDRMETILASMGDGIVLTDSAGDITLFNKAAERLFGVTAERVLGRPIEELTSAPEASALVRRTLAGEKSLWQDLRTELPADRILSIHAAPVQGHRGEITGSVCVLHDVTETRRQAEIRKDFVGNVSHELRTPVASIRAIVGALQSGAMDDPVVAARFLNSLDVETERLSLLLNDLLNLSELESGKLGLKKSEVFIREIAEEAVESLSDKATEYGVFVSVEIPRDVSTYADRRQMLQVMQNLVDNAIKYTGAGGTVEISAEASGAEVSIRVKDTGVGIPPADLDRVFERFYRVDKARSRQMGGTGLGLSIVKDIVEAHCGNVTVESKLGEGSTFTITLPRLSADDGGTS